MTGPGGKSSASGNKINCFLRDRSLSGGRRSTFEGKSAVLPSDVIDFAM